MTRALAGTHSILLLGNAPDFEALIDGLRSHGLPCSPTRAQDLLEAAELTRRMHFDLMICDYRESAHGDLETLHALRSLQPGARVLLVAEERSPQLVIGSIRGCAHALFSRPFESSAARDIIYQALTAAEEDFGIELISALPEFLSLRMRCRYPTADRVVQFMYELREDVPKYIDSIGAFREMLLNAVEHGGRLDSSLWVRVSRVISKDTLIYHIIDPGPGFERANLRHAAIANPPDSPVEHIRYREEKGLRAGGFGMLVAQQLVDQVIYNESGNEVVLIQRLQSGQ